MRILRILKQPENYNILYFIKLTSTHQRILVYCANSDDLGLKSQFGLVTNSNSEVRRLTVQSLLTTQRLSQKLSITAGL